MRKRSWDKQDLLNAVITSYSMRSVIQKLGLIPAGGNYKQVRYYIERYSINITHFKGQAWNKGLKGLGKPRIPLKVILRKNTSYQSYKLKKRLFSSGLKEKMCEECGWCKISSDGRLPLELDHINGDSKDNRIKNLRVLCPNCHSLKPTHRGRNKVVKKTK